MLNAVASGDIAAAAAKSCGKQALLVQTLRAGGNSTFRAAVRIIPGFPIAFGCVFIGENENTARARPYQWSVSTESRDRTGLDGWSYAPCLRATGYWLLLH